MRHHQLFRAIETSAVVLIPALFLLAGCAPAAPPTTIYAAGDSLTEQDYTTALESLMPSDVQAVNHGRSGQSSGMIAVRQGGIELTTAATTIPADGPVVVVPTPSVEPWNFGSVAAASADGSLNGVSGNLARNDSGAWTFTRSHHGQPVSVADDTPFVSSEAESPSDGSILLSWVGRNDVAYDWPTERSGVIAATNSMIERQASADNRFLVLSVTTASSETVGTAGYLTVEAINEGLSEKWNSNFVDVRRQIIDHGLEQAGISPTEADVAAVSGDTLPPSLMTDDIHPNETCRDMVIAPFIEAALAARGWI